MNPAINEAIQAVNNIAPEIWKQAVTSTLIAGFVELCFALMFTIAAVWFCRYAKRKDIFRDPRNPGFNGDVVTWIITAGILALALVVYIVSMGCLLFPEYHAAKSLLTGM